MMHDLWAWVTLIGLGAFHGINPAMGWLFAVALGLQEGKRKAVWRAMPPIALGHAASVALTIVAVGTLQVMVDPVLLRLLAGGTLIGFGLYRLVRGYRHRLTAGMRVGFGGLTFWSFVMASAHGAGLMVVPVLFGMQETAPPMAGHAGHDHGSAIAATALTGVLVVVVHMAAMLATIAVVAAVVYEKIGLAILRQGWINFDLIWALALMGTGMLLFVI
jgi:hypothetical protein